MSDISKMKGFKEYVELCNKLEFNREEQLDSDLRMELMECSVNILKQANGENKEQETALHLRGVVRRFSKEDLTTVYRIGFNHAKACASYQGDNIADAIDKAADWEENINWE